MIELELHVSPLIREVALPLLNEVLRELSGEGSFDEVRYAPPPDDPELRDTWLEGLREDHSSDLAAAARLAAHQHFGSEEAVSIEPDEAEAALRGLTAARLRIRSKHLADVSDAVLEGGALDFEQLVPLQQRGYLAYALAAATQERIVSLLGP